MTDTQKLDKLSRQMDDLIASINGLCDVVETGNELQAKAIELLEAPASSELSDLLKSIVTALNEQGERINTLAGMVVKVGGRVGEVPDKVVSLLRTGIV